MARLIGPLLSERAGGKLGRALIYGRVKNWATVRFATPPRYTRTNLQAVIRQIYGIIIGDWRIVSQSIIDLYKARVEGKPLLPVNSFYEDFFKWIYDTRYGDSRYGIGRYSA